MKSRSVRLALMLAVVMTSPILTFAGGQPAKVRRSGRNETQNRANITQSVKQGKGTGLSLNHVGTGVNANSGATHSAELSTAFTK